jgi:hypothetical protein
MAKNSIEVVSNNLAFVTFAEEKRPEIKKDWSYDYIKYGKKNDFPNELIRYFEEHAEHGAIVNAKARYLFGKGLKAVNPEQEILANQFLENANRYETWNDLGKKLALDCELFNSFYLQIITDMSGNPKEFFQLQYAKCRLSECKTKLYFNEDWIKKPSDFKIFELYNKGEVGTFFTTFKYYQPSKSKWDSIYAKVPYNGCLSEIKSDIDITTFNDSYVKKGFSAGTMVTFFNGEQSPEVKRQIKDRFEQGLCSPDNAGEVVINFADKGGQAAQIQALNVDDLDKKFEFISKRYQQKIVTGHNITNPELFGIKQEGSALGNRVSIKESHELFLNTYTKPRQETFVTFIENICYSVTNTWIELEIEQLDAIGYDLTNDQDLTQDERRTLKGYESLNTSVKPQSQLINDAINALSPLVANKVLESMTEDEIRGLASLPSKTAPKLDINGMPVEELKAEVNSVLTNLTGRQFQGLMRIVSKFDAGKISKESALALMVSAFGLTEADALTFLNENDAIEDAPVKMAEQTNSVLAKFESCARDDYEEFEVLFKHNDHIHNKQDALKLELKAHKMYFADALSVSITELDDAVLNAIQGNPTLTVEQLNTLFKRDVTESLARLTEKGFIETNASGYEASTKGIEKVTNPIDEYFTEIKTIYKYKENPNAPALLPGSKSREFCRTLLRISEKKHWEFEDIDSISLNGEENPAGTNIFDFRGGYYTDPNTKKTTPWCRHIWEAETIKVKTKK